MRHIGQTSFLISHFSFLTSHFSFPISLHWCKASKLLESFYVKLRVDDSSGFDFNFARNSDAAAYHGEILPGRERQAAGDGRRAAAAERRGTAASSQTDRDGEAQPDCHAQKQFLGQRQSLQKRRCRINMKKNILQILIITFVTTIFCYGQSNSWNNLTPLYSTRADAEKLLGKPKNDSCNFACDYETSKEQIRIWYASKNCGASGWNVSTDTILSITVSSEENRGKSFAELKLDRNKFTSKSDDAFNGTWTNAEEGLSYDFGYIDQEFDSISYIPKKTDNHLRCNGFPPYMPESQYQEFDTISFHNPKLSKKDGLNTIYSNMDTFVHHLMQHSAEEYQGYILIYFDNQLSLKDYRKRVNKLKDHIKFRKIPSERIIFIEGGMREESKIEVHILPKHMKPPAPAPTLPSPQFMRQTN